MSTSSLHFASSLTEFKQEEDAAEIQIENLEKGK
jgi:hypothetical protein